MLELTEEHSITDITYPGTFLQMLVVSSSGGFAAYYLILKIASKFSELTAGISMQMQPLWGCIIVWLIGQQQLPGLLTALGICSILPGLVLLRMEVSYNQLKSLSISAANSVGSSRAGGSAMFTINLEGKEEELGNELLLC